MKPVAPAVVDRTKKLDASAYLSSWKEIAVYMRAGVRTVQRYEREFGLPIRRPTGKSRGSVIATRAEIDAWIDAGAIRSTFRLSRIENASRTEATAKRMEAGMLHMRDLKAQMQSLRAETRSMLNLLMTRVSDLRLLMPTSRVEGYGPLVNMYADMPSDLEDGKARRVSSRRRSGRSKDGAVRGNQNLSLPAGKPH